MLLLSDSVFLKNPSVSYLLTVSRYPTPEAFPEMRPLYFLVFSSPTDTPTSPVGSSEGFLVIIFITPPSDEPHTEEAEPFNTSTLSTFSKGSVERSATPSISSSRGISFMGIFICRNPDPGKDEKTRLPAPPFLSRTRPGI